MLRKNNLTCGKLSLKSDPTLTVSHYDQEFIHKLASSMSADSENPNKTKRRVSVYNRSYASFSVWKKMTAVRHRTFW